MRARAGSWAGITRAAGPGTGRRRPVEPRQHPGHDAVAALALELEQPGRGGKQPRAEALLQQPAGAVQARLHRLGAERETGGGLGRAQPLDLAQHEHGAELLGQRVDRGLEQPAQLAARRQPLRVRPVAGGAAVQVHVVRVVRPGPCRPKVLERDHARGGAPPAERLVDGDPRQPGRESPRLRELAQPGVGAQVGLLQHVLGLGVAPRAGCGRAGTGGGCGAA